MSLVYQSRTVILKNLKDQWQIKLKWNKILRTWVSPLKYGTFTGKVLSEQIAIIAELSNPWDVRKVVGAATKNKLFKQSGFLVTYDLSPKDEEIEQKLLSKRIEILKSGTDKKRLKIRGLKLYKDEVGVKRIA